MQAQILMYEVWSGLEGCVSHSQLTLVLPGPGWHHLEQNALPPLGLQTQVWFAHTSFRL